MTWALILGLLVLGLILILLEVIFVPGTTVVGILGLAFSALGVYLTFVNYDSSTALWVLGLTAMTNVGVIFYGFKSGVWKRFSLKDTISSRTYDDRLEGLQVGLRGKTVSDIKPYGKAEFGDTIYEVKSNSGFIPAGQDVEIQQLEYNRIIIK
ncbi:nodulation protein NfeD [Echinicola strongylocentroti]|uniref:Nodulation protein NfeD n=1 Tax=Echinicola strongylocentroti TaxID=1795355 RepID=A0A2Z4IGU3_9BACT|nr:NfeD family protein [Echinicola strongylocentroti]AWW29927.1 nodulation protein NfeD [Echinicola strongylocentroti]